VRDLIMEGYRTDTLAYFSKVIYSSTSNAVPLGVNPTGAYAINVVSTARVVYVFVRALPPIAVSFKQDDSTLYSVQAGPGLKPLGTWVSADTTSNYQPTTTQLPNPAGGVVGSFVVYSSTTNPYASGYWSDTSANWTTASTQRAGDYAFAVQFEDSNTGRRSQLSDSVAVTFSGIDRKFTVVGIVDTAKYDTVKIWRSVRNTNAAGIFTAGILQLEATFLASSNAITTTGPSWTSPSLAATVVKWAYAVQKDDRQLVMQDTFQDKPSFMNNAPYGGAAVAYQSQLFVSNIEGQVASIRDQMQSVGEIRWSSPSDASYELFAPKGRWNPDMFGDVPITFQQAGQMLVGFSGNQVYFILRDGVFVRVMPAHTGYGVVGPYGAASIGPMIYYITHQGVRVLYPDGRLDEVGAMDWLISQGWSPDLESMSVGFDSRTTALYFLNPVKNRMAILWFSTGIVSELHDIPFIKAARGLFPRSLGGALEDTAIFLHSPTDIYYDSSNTGFRARLMIPAKSSTDRVRTPPVNNTYEGYHYGMLDGNCDRCVKAVVSDYSQVVDRAVAFTWVARPTIGWTPDWTIIGSYMKIVGDSYPKSSSLCYFNQALQNTFKIVGVIQASEINAYVGVIGVPVADAVTPVVDSGDSYPSFRHHNLKTGRP
jgi:hypothetical protein